MTRPDGRQFTIDAPENSADDFYVQSLRLNGKEWSHNYIGHDDLVKGSNLHFGMGSEPNPNRGTLAEDRP